VRIKRPDQLIYVGNIVLDSLFDGEVKYYDSSGIYLGHASYNCGYKEGVEVNYYKNGMIRDSSFYHNDLQNGFVYQFDRNGTLQYKVYYMNDLPIGHVYEFDQKGDVTRYYFVNFEHKIIYELYKINGEDYREGDGIQMSIFSKGSSKNNFLFLYLFASPFTPQHYEFGVLDSNNKVMTTRKIVSEECYYEQELLPLPKGYKYAVILHRYNPFKKRDDIVIQTTE
jgi:antitoxin component YwqK of YwqJK toxin-antitoxin module